MTESAENEEIWLLLDSRAAGGIESHVFNLACALAHRHHRVRVLFWRHYGPHPLQLELARQNIESEFLDGTLRSLLRRIGGHHQPPRLLHTHGYKAGLLGRLAARLRRIPVVSTFHAGEPGTGKLRFYNLLDRLSSRSGERIAVSRQIADLLPAGTTVIDNFVGIPSPFPPGSDDHCIAFAGRMVTDKGPDLFCRIACQQPGNYQAWGDGPLLDALRRRFSGAVKFQGAVPGMDTVWPAVDLLLMPSRYEGLPLAALEAMARGIPVIAFAVGGLPGLISSGVNGWLAEPGNLAQISRMVGHWQQLEATERRKIGENARRTILERYSPDVVLPQILAVYDRSCGDSATSRVQPQ